MLKTIFQNICFLIVGLILGWILGCNQREVKIQKEEKILIKYDTIQKTTVVEIPKPEVKYLVVTDSFFNLITDTCFIEKVVSRGDSVRINVYKDSILDQDYALNYEISTFGQLLDFKYDLDLYSKTETIIKTQKIKPKWMISGSISNRLNYKLGLGYKGWTIEGEFKKNLNQIYIGKQFNF